jgi:hypothetical protein
MSAMEGIEFNDFESFKTALIKEFSKTNDASRNEVKELYRIILTGPKENDLIDFVLDQWFSIFLRLRHIFTILKFGGTQI